MFLISIYQNLLCYLSKKITRQVACTNYFSLTLKLSETNYEKFLKVPLNPMKHYSDSIGWEMAKNMHNIVLNSKNQRCFLE
jgi:hypothetical protein